MVAIDLVQQSSIAAGLAQICQWWWFDFAPSRRLSLWQPVHIAASQSYRRLVLPLAPTLELIVY